jgi:long-chain acyl-CoA synthetase
MSTSTLPGLLVSHAAGRAAKTAIRHHTFGIWEPTTWAQLLHRAGSIGAGLASVGVNAGDTVALIAENQPVWIAADFAIQGLGATVLAIDPFAAADPTVSALRKSAAHIAIVGDQQQFDKVEDARIAGNLPDLRLIVVIETRGIRHLDVANRQDADRIETLQGIEKRASESSVGVWQSGVAQRKGSDIAVQTIDGSLLTHDQLLAGSAEVASRVGLSSKDVLLPQRSFANVHERALSVTGLLTSNCIVNIGEGDRLSGAELNAVQPTLLHVSEKWLDHAAAQLQGRMDQTKGLKKLAVSAGWKPGSPKTSVGGGAISPLKIIGLATLAAQFLYLLATPKGNDLIRVAAVLGIAVAGILIAILTGAAVRVPLRRLLGLSRARAVLVEGTPSAGAQMLGALTVPMLAISTSASSKGSNQ